MTEQATLYTITGSHPGRSGELMLQHKGVPYRRVELMAGFHRMSLRLRGFAGDRVPAVVFPDGRRGQYTRPLARLLDELYPDAPRLVPADPRVAEAELWGEKALQAWARRMVAMAAARSLDLLHDRGKGGRMGPLLHRREPVRRMIAMTVLLAFKVGPRRRREDPRRVPEMLDRVDGWIAEGVLGGEQLNAADFQIATSLALVDYRRDVRAAMQGRPLYELLERVLPLPAG